MTDDWRARQRLSDQVATEHMNAGPRYPRQPAPRCPSCKKRCGQTEQFVVGKGWFWYSACCGVRMAEA